MDFENKLQILIWHGETCAKMVTERFIFSYLDIKGLVLNGICMNEIQRKHDLPHTRQTWFSPHQANTIFPTPGKQSFSLSLNAPHIYSYMYVH